MEKNPVGRPPGKPYPVRKLVRFSSEDARLLELIVRQRACRANEVLRQLVREEAKREGLE